MKCIKSEDATLQFYQGVSRGLSSGNLYNPDVEMSVVQYNYSLRCGSCHLQFWKQKKVEKNRKGKVGRRDRGEEEEPDSGGST